MSQKLKLLYEYVDATVVTESVENDIGQKEKVYKIKGIFSTIGEKNRNGRIYSKKIWETNVKKYQTVIESGSINRLCEWQHPERTSVDPMEAVAAINSLEISEDGKYVIGEATLLNNPKANQLKSLIDNGIKLSVSSRGTGTVRNNVVENFDLITYDLVDNPSDYNASMHGFVSESIKTFERLEDGTLVESVETTVKSANAEVTETAENTDLKETSENTENTANAEVTEAEAKIKAESELKEAFRSFINILKLK